MDCMYQHHKHISQLYKFNYLTMVDSNTQLDIQWHYVNRHDKDTLVSSSNNL